MGNKKVEIKHPIRLTIGSTLLVISGMAFGTFESMEYFLNLDKSSVWIPITGIFCLIIGIGFICWGSERKISEKVGGAK